MARLRFIPALALVAGAGLALRICYCLLVAGKPHFLTDPDYYRLLATVIAHGHGFVEPYGLVFRGIATPTAIHPPLYPLFLAGVVKLGGTSLAAQRIALSLVGTGTVVLVGLLGRRVAGERVGLIAAGLAAVYPLLVIADGSLMAESLYGLLIAATLLCAYRAIDRPTLPWAALLGGLIGLAALTRSEALLLVPLLGLALWRGGPDRRGRRLAALVAACVLVLVPWSVRNATVFANPVVVSTNESLTLAGANCHLTYFGAQLAFWSPDCAGPPRVRDESRQASRWTRQGLRYAGDHLGRVPVVLALRVLGTWDFYRPGRSVGRQAHDELRALGWQKAGTAMYYVLFVLAVAGVWIMRRRRQPLLVLLAPIVMVTISTLVSYGLERFRFAAEIPLLVLAAVTLPALHGGATAFLRAQRTHGGSSEPVK